MITSSTAETLRHEGTRGWCDPNPWLPVPIRPAMRVQRYATSVLFCLSARQIK